MIFAHVTRSQIVALSALSLTLLAGCLSPGERATLLQENGALQTQVEALERKVVDRDGTISSLRRQIESLQGFGPDRPAAIFAPVEIKMASLSGGADYDGKPGDDGITVHLQLIDADGDAVKAPGAITVQLLDNSDLNKPVVIGVYRFDDPETLRKAWFGRFGTQHYTLKCPFPPGVKLPASRRVTASAEYIDYLTGKTLTTTAELEFAMPGPK